MYSREQKSKVLLLILLIASAFAPNISVVELDGSQHDASIRTTEQEVMFSRARLGKQISKWLTKSTFFKSLLDASTWKHFWKLRIPQDVLDESSPVVQRIGKEFDQQSGIRFQLNGIRKQSVDSGADTFIDLFREAYDPFIGNSSDSTKSKLAQKERIRIIVPEQYAEFDINTFWIPAESPTQYVKQLKVAGDFYESDEVETSSFKPATLLLFYSLPTEMRLDFKNHIRLLQTSESHRADFYKLVAERKSPPTKLNWVLIGAALTVAGAILWILIVALNKKKKGSSLQEVPVEKSD